eukprot:10603-Heterococcus_DN1.PRE.3
MKESCQNFVIAFNKVKEAFKPCVTRNQELEKEVQKLKKEKAALQRRVRKLEKQSASAGQKNRASLEGDAESSEEEEEEESSAAQAQQRAQKGAAGRQAKGSTLSKAARQRTEGDVPASGGKRKRDNSKTSKVPKGTAAASSKKKGSGAKASKAPAESSGKKVGALVSAGPKNTYGWAEDEPATADTTQQQQQQPQPESEAAAAAAESEAEDADADDVTDDSINDFINDSP